MRRRSRMPKQRTRGTYTPEDLDQAIKELKNNISFRDVARRYGIPKSTLHFKLKNPGHKTTSGPSPILTIEEEAHLENWIKELEKKGFPLKKEDLQSSVQKFLIDNPRPNPFKNNYPGEGWIRAFMRRHPSIVFKPSDGGTQASIYVSEQDIRKWFAEIRQYFIENELLDVLNDPKRVFNGAETGFQLCPHSGKVVAMKDKKILVGTDSSKPKETISVVLTFSAASDSCPPMMIYKHSISPSKAAEGLPEGWGVAKSESGRMTSEIFYEYITNVFYPYLKENIVLLPVIYFLDGNKTHITYEVSKLCKELSIELIALYPNATRILQPANVGVFRPVKLAWKEVSTAWLKENPGQEITKSKFAAVLDKALKKSLKPATLKNAFRASGLVPFNPEAVDYSRCLPNSNQNVLIMPKNSQNAQRMDSTISFSQFLDTVGSRKFEELQHAENVVEGESEDFQILHKLFLLFNHSNRNLKTSRTETISELNISEKSEPSDSPKTSEYVNANVNVSGSNSVVSGIIQTNSL